MRHLAVLGEPPVDLSAVIQYAAANAQIGHA